MFRRSGVLVALAGRMFRRSGVLVALAGRMFRRSGVGSEARMTDADF
jgi:hypothetical protein